MPRIINSHTPVKTLKHDELLELFVNAGKPVGVTAEQCGMLLHDACSHVGHWGSPAFRDSVLIERAAARRQIRDLMGADAAERLMSLETKLYR